MTHIICGVDVSSEKLDARIGLSGPHVQVDRTPPGIARLVAWCREHGATFCVMEATGGYERLVLAELWQSQMPAAMACPRRVRQFAQSQGILEKTDKIDAGVIARFAEIKNLRPLPPPSLDQQRLAALVTRLRQVTQLRVSQKNQLHSTQDEKARASIHTLLACIRADMRGLEAQIIELIGSDPLWSRLDAALRTFKGVADRTVATLIAHLPEIGIVSNKAVAKLVGLAPIVNRSGKGQTTSHIAGGRTGVRNLLYIVASLVAKYDKDFAGFQQRLRLAGKPKNVIRIALAHKLAVRLNAKAREARRDMQHEHMQLENMRRPA